MKIKQNKKKKSQKGGGNRNKFVLTRKNISNLAKNKSKRVYCAPSSEEDHYTCFSKKALLNIIDSWNRSQSEKIYYNNNERKHNLWSKINDKLKGVCDDNEVCWTRQPFLKKSKKNKSVKQYLRPVMPHKWYDHRNEWLNTLDIDAVLKQYQNKYKNFYYLGAIPIDFDYKLSPGQCVINELCNIKLKSLLNKKKIN